jgi:prolipoprotein diacylglyceryltransferase
MQVKLPVGKLGGVGSITALLFVFYGLAAIIPAVMKILQDQMDGDEIRQLIVGGVFVFFGIVIFIKAKRAQRKTSSESA